MNTQVNPSYNLNVDNEMHNPIPMKEKQSDFTIQLVNAIQPVPSSFVSAVKERDMIVEKPEKVSAEKVQIDDSSKFKKLLAASLVSAVKGNDAKDENPVLFEKADVDGWKRYVEEHPPTPEALACLITIGLENYRKMIAKKAGKGKGAAAKLARSAFVGVSRSPRNVWPCVRRAVCL
jgi:hypothetical protein